MPHADDKRPRKGTSPGTGLPSAGECNGTSKSTGKPCKLPVVYGTTVCRFHGGNAPHVLQAAARRLVIDAAPKAAETLTDLLDDPKDKDPCPLCKRGMPREDMTKFRTATALLDRSGIGPTSKIELEATIRTEFVRFLSTEQLEQIDAWIEVAKAKAAEEIGEDVEA